MRGIRELISGFIDRQGGYLMIAAMLSKVASYVTSIYVLNALTKAEFGSISFAYTTLSFVIPFMGMGIAQSMLRFGAQSPENTANLLGPAIRIGTIICLALIALTYSGFLMAGPDLEGLTNYALILCFMILTLFWSELLRSYCRARLENKTVAYADIIQAASLFAVALLSAVSPEFYPVALVLAPLVAAVYMLAKSKVSISTLTAAGKIPRQWFSYGVFISISAVLAQLMFAVDVLNIGYILEEEERLATYKASTILPVGFFIIPATFIGTDLAVLVQKAGDRVHIWKYFRRFSLMFFTIGCLVALGFYLFGSDIAHFFAPKYDSTELGRLMFLISVGGIGAMALRIPTGNLLTAVGWARTNAMLSLATLVLNIVLNYILIRRMGIEGAAWATMLLLWVSGLLGLGGLLLYLRHLKRQEHSSDHPQTTS